MKKSQLPILLLLCTVPLAAQDFPAEAFVGQWNCKSEAETANLSSNGQYDLKADATFSSQDTIRFLYEGNEFVYKTRTTGKWAVKGDRYTETTLTIKGERAHSAKTLAALKKSSDLQKLENEIFSAFNQPKPSANNQTTAIIQQADAKSFTLADTETEDTLYLHCIRR